MNIIPLKDKVLLGQNQTENITASGIIIEGSVEESKTATVLAIGPEVTDVAINDVVLLEWKKATIVKVGDAHRVMVSQKDIIAIL
jgi:co-chaperonin GroES (HSP10)